MTTTRLDQRPAPFPAADVERILSDHGFIEYRCDDGLIPTEYQTNATTNTEGNPDE